MSSVAGKVSVDRWPGFLRQESTSQIKHCLSGLSDIWLVFDEPARVSLLKKEVNPCEADQTVELLLEAGDVW